MNPNILGVMGPGFLNQVPTLHISQLLLYGSAVAATVGNTPGDHRSITQERGERALSGGFRLDLVHM